MIARSEAPATVVLRLDEAERATVTSVMQRLKAVFGRHVEAHEAVRAVLAVVGPQTPVLPA